MVEIPIDCDQPALLPAGDPANMLGNGRRAGSCTAGGFHKSTRQTAHSSSCTWSVRPLRMYRHGVDWDYLEDYWLAFESPVCSLPFHLLAIASSELDQKLDQLNSILCPASCTLLLLAQSYLMFSSCGSGISYRL